ncbi:nesprin-1-like [Clupea harengus]|uniref:Nesprin-1-like n=1 Tax=Clupea harengus TaxID=7950 RepID=A0A6P8GQR4_CLUHA|nr:nesprin-1-like [Clupea harengus]
MGISARATACLTDTVWRRWTRLSSAVRSRERALESTALEWRSFEEKVEKARAVAEDLQSRAPESAVPAAASRAALQSLLEYHDCFCLEAERERASLALLGQQARALLPSPTQEGAQGGQTLLLPSPTQGGQTLLLPSPTQGQSEHRDISCLQEHYHRLLQRVKGGRESVQAELEERGQVERELSLVEGWIQDTRGLLLSPSADLDTLLIELEAAREDVLAHRQTVEDLSGQQLLKYEQLQSGLTHTHTHTQLQSALPSDLQTQLAEITLSLGAAEDQVHAREQEVLQTRALKEDLSGRVQELLERIGSVCGRLEEKSRDMEDAQEDTRSVCEELEGCGSTLRDLKEAHERFGEQNPLLLRHLRSSMGRLAHAHRRAATLAQECSTQLLKAEDLLEEYTDVRSFIMSWAQKAESLTSCSVVWSPSAQIHEQIRAHQSLLRKCPELQVDLEGMVQKVSQLSAVLHTHAMNQQVAALSQHVEEQQDAIRSRLESLQDAAEDVGRLEGRVKALHGCLEHTQATLTCPELAHANLRQQLAHRQHLLSEMEDFQQQVEMLQRCQSALRLPEEVVSSLPLCNTAQSLRAEASQLQHSVIQQCAILQEAVLQHEQYEQEVTHLQRLVEEAHRIIQDRPVNTNNIQELQTQIQHHEELAQKTQGYQEQIWALNSKCRMLRAKAKHATMLLSVPEVPGGLSDGLDELGPVEEDEEEEEEEEEEMARHPSAHPSVVMMTAGRCHTLLSPVAEESGEEGTNSEVSSPPACRSPSPGASADTTLTQGSGKASISRAPLQEVFDSASSSATNLDDLQRSWETLKNVISEKQRSLCEALERQQHYQESLQSVSTKMEAIETALNQGLDHGRSPESHMATHQALLDEILMLQDEMRALQDCFSEELHCDTLEGEGLLHCDTLEGEGLHCDTLEGEESQQQALQSTLTVLGERMATIRMKASGRRQLLEERLSDQLEEQRQEQALQRCHSEAEELDHWLLSTRATLSSALQPRPQDMDMEEQLIDCQDMLMEIEQKVSCLSELSVHSESLLLEGRGQTRGGAEQLSQKLHGLKASLVALQRILQDKQTHIQGSLQEPEDSECVCDSTLSQSPNFQDWLIQVRTSRGQQRHDHVQRQRELEEQLAEQKKLLQSVASRGEELLTQQATPNGDGSSV